MARPIALLPAGWRQQRPHARQGRAHDVGDIACTQTHIGEEMNEFTYAMPTLALAELLVAKQLPQRKSDKNIQFEGDFQRPRIIVAVGHYASHLSTFGHPLPSPREDALRWACFGTPSLANSIANKCWS